MKLSLRTKLSWSYITLAMICVVLISIIVNFSLEKQFKSYIMNNQEAKSKDIVSLVSQQYDDSGRWRTGLIEDIGINALEQGLIMKVIDASGSEVWSATSYNNGMCEQMLMHVSKNMSSRYPNWKGKYVESKYPILHNGRQAGTVEIGYYGPFFFNDQDLIFINTLNRSIIGVGVLSLLFSLIFGTIMSKRISSPVSRVIKTAKSISKGNFGDRSFEKSNISEINELTDSINNLAVNLERQEILRKRLTQDVAHELRTPLATLQSHMEAMIDGIWKPEIERLKSCHEEIIRINNMVGDLEKLSRYESDNLILNKTSFDLQELVNSLLLNFEKEFMDKKIKINCDIENIIVMADKDKISQVIINLLSNALKYTPECGSIEIYGSKEKDRIKLSIKDTGIGISDEDLPLIFERFYRADKSRNRLTGGAGIGLTIVKAIVEAHGGTIYVESKINKGAKFTISLPY